MPIQGTKRATGMSVLSDQERTKSTIVSRVSWGTQHLFSVPHFFFFARKLGFELLDLGLLSVFDSLGLAAIVEGSMAVLEELLEPAVELVGIDVEFIAEVGDRDLVDEMTFENGNLLGAGKMTTRLVH